ncbi:MAG: 2-oxoglutarate dehydrogenase complex dihydrolipoyllysine-residue succinyltransferase [Thermomicrobiales bacterium]
MSIEIRVPPLGESLVDAVVGAWMKGEGESVNRGDVLVELETDKVNLEVAATEDGVLGKIEKQAGDVVTVGEVLGTIAEGAGAPAAAPAAAEAKPAEAPAAAPAPVAAAPAPAPAAPPGAGCAASRRTDGRWRTGRPGRAHARLRTRRRSRQPDRHRSGRTRDAGRCLHRRRAGQAQRNRRAGSCSRRPGCSGSGGSGGCSAAAHPQEERIKMSRRRQTIANRLVEAQQTAAMLTTFNEVDLTAVMDLRSKRKDAFKEKHGVGLGFMSFFTKAVVGALKAYPRLNAEIQGDEMVLKKHYDIGIAVGAEEGLVVPVVREADRLSFAQIEQEIVTLAGKARENKLTLDELMGGTFTITNGGIFGSMLSTPILNTPQVGILGMHAIQQRPVARDGEVVIRPMMYIALSYDHRIVDGREAVLFLVKVKELLEDPTNLLEG